MKLKFNLIYFIGFFLLVSCSNTSTQENMQITPDIILKDFDTWWNYNYKKIKLYEDYIPLDTASNIISRESFLQSLTSGNYIALKLKTTDSSFKYKLYKLGPLVDNDIRLQVKQLARNEYQRYKMEGTEIPNFNFTDLNGKVYNRETTKGKIIVLKCWFVHCQVCVEEMPALNEIVKQYQNRNDILFISLAFDTKEELKIFLTKTKFDYAVIPIQQEYLEEKLKVNEYPTQFIINKKGLISKIVSDYHDMIVCLKKEVSK